MQNQKLAWSKAHNTMEKQRDDFHAPRVEHLSIQIDKGINTDYQFCCSTSSRVGKRSGDPLSIPLYRGYQT